MRRTLLLWPRADARPPRPLLLLLLLLLCVCVCVWTRRYKKKLASKLFQGGLQDRRILAFGSRAAPAADDPPLRVLYNANREAAMQPRKYTRHIPQSPERILDAPDLLDDYYLNLLDWNAQNILGVALGDSVYLWNAGNGGITQLMQTSGEGSHVTSVAWSQKASLMAIGTSNNEVQLWDTEKCELVRNMPGHCARVGALAWNGHVLSSGSRDATINHHDHRVPRHRVATLHGHQQEVCGLKWSPWGTQLASGGNDNLLNVWDDRRVQTAPPVFTFDQHRAAVKALAWCPWQKNLLASGGGTADRMIRFWNTGSGSFLNAVDTHSQVCALQWSQHDKEIVSSHGFSHNQLILWKYPHMVKASELTGHTARVLHLAQSPDGTTVVSAAADETLRFWKILSGGQQQRRQRSDVQDSLVSPSAWTGASVVR